MKIVLETIPVWDGLNSDSECFLCDLMKMAESDALGYYLSSAVMTPEVRVETNTYGFCHNHMRALAEANKPQVLALVMDTYYEENKKFYKPELEKIFSSRKAKHAEKAIAEFKSRVVDRERGCLVCSRMDDRLYRYCYTVSSLFEEDSDFREKLLLSKGFCLQHTLELARIAPEALSGDCLLEFYKAIFSLLDKNLDRVQHDDWWMSQKYKSENKDKPWNGCEDAQKRAVYKLVGTSPVIDPIKGKKSRI